MGTTKWVADRLQSTKRGIAIAEMAGAWNTDRASGNRSMTDNNSAADKRNAVEHLNFGAKTSKRVGWESFEFTIVGPHQVEVTNASWGFQKDDHSYIVGVEDRDGVVVPAECGCKADRFREDYDCKHKVALASVGGPVVLQAAVDCPTPTVDGGESTPQTLEERLRADGGAVAERAGDDPLPLDAEEHEECDCDDLPDDFPCADCFIEGRKELPE